MKIRVNLDLKNKINILFAVSLVLLTGIYCLTLLSLKQKDEAIGWVTNTHDVIETLDSILFNVRDAEVGERSYLISHDPQYLKFYHASLQALQQELETLEQLTPNQGLPGQDLHQLVSLIRQWELVSNHRVENRDVYGLRHPQPLPRSLSASELEFIRQVRLQVYRMKRMDDQLLRRRQADARQTSGQTVWFINAVALFVLFLLLGVFVLYRQLNQNLEEMVLARTKKLELSEQDLANYATQLRQSNRELEQFAAVASHDLKAPLRKVRTFVEMLGKDSENQLSSDSLSYLERMLNATEQMQNLIDDLLSLSRVTSGGKDFKPVCLRAVMEEVRTNLQGLIDANGGQLEVAPLPVVEGDYTQIIQLFQNLVENGLKFHREQVPPVVQVSALPVQHGYVQIQVRDNGIGLETEDFQRIFKIFERLHGHHHYAGTGIGLAVVKKIVERHQGSIQVESTVGEGSMFTVRLAVPRTDEVVSPTPQNGASGWQESAVQRAGSGTEKSRVSG